MTSETDKFFYQGKFFPNEEEFWSYVKDFDGRQITYEDFEGFFYWLKKDVWANLSMYEAKISNAEMRSILQEMFFLILKRIFEEKKEIKDVQ